MIRVSNLECGYEKFRLKNINLTVNSGEMLGIIGPNGSGKTTFFKALTRIIKPSCGGITLDDKNIFDYRQKEFAKEVAVVSQNIEPEFIRVEDFVIMGRISHFESMQFFETRRDYEIAERNMELTDTRRLKGKYLDEISGGELQLVCIAKALTQGSRILLLDEPISHLDISHQIKILELIKSLNKNLGYTIIMILHDLNLACEYCDRLVLFNNGEIYKTGNPEEVVDYKTIEEVYKTVVVVKRNPISKKPYVILVSQETINKNRLCPPKNSRSSKRGKK